jgi:hypothetical protein
MRKKAAISFLLLAIAIVMLSCGRKLVSPHEYVKWMKDKQNGLFVTKTIADFEFSLQYKSAEFIAIEQIRSDSVSSKTIEDRKRAINGMQYYTFRIKALDGKEVLQSGIADESEYASRLEYFLSYAKADISLIENGDTLACALYHFERNYGLSPITNIVLGFERKPGSESADKTFIYNDQVLNSGPVQLTIQAHDIQQIPLIDYANH